MRGPNGSQNGQVQVEQRRQRITELYLTGKSQSAIGSIIGISQKAVSKHLQRVRAVWLQRSVEDYGTRLAEEIARLDAVEKRAWESWERSCQPAKPGGEPRAGDPKFLERIHRCIETRLKLLGALKPDQKNMNVNVVSVDWDSMLQGRPDEANRVEERLRLAGPADAIEVSVAPDQDRAALERRLAELEALANGTHNGNGASHD